MHVGGKRRRKASPVEAVGPHHVLQHKEPEEVHDVLRQQHPLCVAPLPGIALGVKNMEALGAAVQAARGLGVSGHFQLWALRHWNCDLHGAWGQQRRGLEEYGVWQADSRGAGMHSACADRLREGSPPCPAAVRVPEETQRLWGPEVQPSGGAAPLEAHQGVSPGPHGGAEAELARGPGGVRDCGHQIVGGASGRRRGGTVPVSTQGPPFR
mmetsp:Transcript_20834/g.57812  ORF Transcript_20834/g.57812 Transcript_20834/m.57812 type:complete len:211 (+) Transcript_20834:1289-1921(+)